MKVKIKLLGYFIRHEFILPYNVFLGYSSVGRAEVRIRLEGSFFHFHFVH